MSNTQPPYQSFSFVEILEIQHLRNITSSLVNLSPSINIFLGKNGAGKSSFCEAISLLFHGRSFRPSVAFSNLIQESKSGLQIQAKLSSSQGFTKIKMEKKSVGGWSVNQDGQVLNRLKDLTKLMPILIMSPDIENIVDTDPSGRRKVLDWLMFHVEHSYAESFQKYSYALKQRNTLLKSAHKTKDELRSWTQELLQQAQMIQTLRSNVMTQVTHHLKLALMGTQFNGYTIELYAGWDNRLSLSQAFEKSFKEEAIRKTTLVGPHRADLIITDNQSNLIKPLLSRGEKKRLSLYINLALVGFLKESLGKKTLMLVDDWNSELDKGGRSFVLEQVEQHGMQVILTATDVDPELTIRDHFKMFHVEHGLINEVTNCK